MSVIKLNINGREVSGFEGQTILDIAKENGIDIPTLCHDDRVKMYGACGVCVVEMEGSYKLLRSCSTFAADGMVIDTESERVRASRESALELLLSDHDGDCRPPCMLACPAETDCQGYVGLIANGEYKEALKLIKDKIPLPASIGRVCPHPCEEACRRELVEEPVSIAALKAFAGDIDLQNGEPYTADIGEATGKRVAIVGGGPGGLTAAYFLRAYGHEVTVYDAMPEMGGMLRYGIPEYRLPKKLLKAECDAIEKMGVTYKNNIKIGRDITLDYLRGAYDAVIVAVGAWTSTGLRCKGEELDGVVGGIDFLRDVALNNPVFTGRKIAVVGGGNTAMDACRTSIRLGAEVVYNIYRRTRNEMPAEEIEIVEAEEEGVVFKNLTNPNEVMGEDGKVKAVRLQIMELGEPDSSGRRAPVPVEGKEETLEADTVIVAIGQKLDGSGFDALDKTRWNTIIADETTFRTNLPGVFAVGDAVNDGAGIAITAIGEAKKAAVAVDKYLNGEEPDYEPRYLVKSEKTAEDFADREKEPRTKMPHRCAVERKKDFLEINHGLSEEEAKREAGRCLECGCHDYFECKLIGYANRYKVAPEKYEGKAHRRNTLEEHPFIRRNPDKCVLCGLCVRICDEVVGATALGLVGRGFDTIVRPALEADLADTDCIACGQCVAVCPTGALTETMMLQKQVPVAETATKTTCSFCSVGCGQKLTSIGGSLIRSIPSADKEKDALLCSKGRFGFGELAKKPRIAAPLIAGEETTYEKAYILANKSLQALQTQYGKGCIAVAASDRLTSEELLLIRRYAAEGLKTDKVFCFGRVEGGIAEVLGRDGSTCTLDELENTDLIVVVESDLTRSHAVAGMRVRRAVESGAKLLLLSGADNSLSGIAELRLGAGNDLALLKQMAKAILDSGKGKELEGCGALATYLTDVKPGEGAMSAAEMILGAKKAVFVFEKNALTADAAKLVADIAALSGHTGKPRSGVIQLLSGANAQGLADLGIDSGDKYREAIESGEIRGLFIFGEDVPDLDLSRLDFLAVQDLHMTKTAARANVVFPGSSFAEIEGGFVSADGRAQRVRKVVASVPERDSFTQLTELSAHAGADLGYRGIGDVTHSLASLPRPQGITIRLAVPADGRLLRDMSPDTNALAVSFEEFAEKQGLKAALPIRTQSAKQEALC